MRRPTAPASKTASMALATMEDDLAAGSSLKNLKRPGLETQATTRRRDTQRTF
jgi:hypothetical protein